MQFCDEKMPLVMILGENYIIFTAVGLIHQEMRGDDLENKGNLAKECSIS